MKTWNPDQIIKLLQNCGDVALENYWNPQIDLKVSNLDECFNLDPKTKDRWQAMDLVLGAPNQGLLEYLKSHLVMTR